MRVTYHRELKIKAMLDEIGVENFLPLRETLVITRTGKKKHKKVPAINIIFVRSTQEFLTGLKMSRVEFDSMRYIKKKTTVVDDKSEILTVPDKEMDNFMNVASAQDNQVMFLDINKLKKLVGRKVRVTGGPFKGVEGIFKRIDNNRKVVVNVEGVASVAISFIPSSLLEFI